MIELHRKPTAMAYIDHSHSLDPIINSCGWHEIVDARNDRQGFVTFNEQCKRYTVLGMDGTLSSTNNTGLRNHLNGKKHAVCTATIALSANTSSVECQIKEIPTGDTFNMGTTEEYIVAGATDLEGFTPCLTVGGLRPTSLSGDLVAYPTNTVVSIGH
ncbi:hypothetical protein MYOV003v1_p0003 [Vibrio phage 207E48.1]|nr:hypothetical protein MYOV003v1_p0003 [Vibrio phage 207E48.1]